MIKIVQKQDIEDILTGNIDAVKSVVYYTHLMAAEDGIHPLIKREGDVLKCKLFSNQLEELTTGNLICQVEIVEHDEEYPDREYNEIKKQNLDIWIKGKDPEDETLRVGYENLTIGLKQGIDKANTAVQPDELEHYVKVEDFESQISEKADRNDVYVKDEIDTQMNTLRGEIPSLEGFATEEWVESQGYLTEHQTLKTINGEVITGEGDVKVGGVGVKLANGADVFNRYKVEGVINNSNIDDFEHGPLSHAEGYTTQSKGNVSHAEGVSTKANGIASHAEGQNGEANGNYSHVEGFATLTNSENSHAEGMFNKGYTDTIHEVGIGSTYSRRKNAHTITKEGLHYILGVGGYTGVESLEDVDDLATVLNSKISLDDVYSKDEIDTQINTLRGEIPSVDDFITVGDVYDKSEIDSMFVAYEGLIPSTDDFATFEYVDTQITERMPSTDDFATTEYVDGLIGELDTILDRILS